MVDLSAYDEIRPVSEELLAAKRDGKWGYLNTKGEEAIDFKYDEAKKFIFSGKARVGITDNSNDYRSFIMNKEGEEVDWQPSD
ncbi:WG repeat-containing protein [Psychrobacter pygoscelis]|uniref:WG repeat-containing protein n=1 Tax=Psychrobacter pygoscelis TaxID=2488563 RepID=UPI0013F4866D